ncbi:MAG: hypothetical protein HKN20_13245 [Gemmatimonadetes bacterium]|nr:hypothetical protein [Gemmatimonadota bacterium]
MKVPVGWEEWADYFDGRLEDEDRVEELREILKSGSEAAPHGEEVGNLIEVLRSMRLHEMPHDLRDRLIAHVRAEVESGSKDADAVERFLATLSFDSGRETAGSQRSGVMEEARTLLFEAGPYEVSIRLGSDGNGRWNVSGRVFDDNEASHSGGMATLQDESAGWTAPLDDHDEFVFESIPDGRYTLTIAIASHRIEVGTIEVP